MCIRDRSTGGQHRVEIKEHPEGRLIIMGDMLAFVITPGDIDPLSNETLATTAEKAAANLRQVIGETREARDLHAILKGIAWSALATAILVALLWACLLYTSRCV